jgi:DNA replication protein DnaC
MSQPNFEPLSASGMNWAQRVNRLRGKHEHYSSEGSLEQSSQYNCGICRDTRWQSHLVDGTEVVRRCDCVQRHIWASGVPLEFRTATLENYEPRPGSESALIRARGFFSGTRDLLLVGGVGAGKTRLACSLLNTEPAKGYFVRVPTMLRQLEPSSDPETRAVVLERRLLTVPILVLDDVGAERDQATDFTRRTLYMVYEGRHDEGLRTIWTSNKNLGELGEMHGDDRLTSRIAGWADVVLVNCSDQRLPVRRT